MNVFIYYQSDPEILGYKSEIKHQIQLLSNALPAKRFEIQRSTDERYRGHRARLLRALRTAGYVLIVTDYHIRRFAEVYSSPYLPIKRVRDTFDYDVLSLMSLRPASAVMEVGDEDYRIRDRFNLKYFRPGFNEEWPYKAMLNEIAQDIENSSAMELRNSEKFADEFRKAYKAAKGTDRKRWLVSFDIWLEEFVIDNKRASLARQYRKAVADPAGDMARRLRGPGEIHIWLGKLNDLDPDWRERETENDRAKRIRNWLRVLDQSDLDLRYEGGMQTDIRWFAENHAEDALKILNARRIPVPPRLPYRSVEDIVTNRVYIRRWFASHTDASLADYDKKTSELIDKHSISHSLLAALLLEHDAAEWLTGWARGRVKRMLDDWPQDPPSIYDEEYSGTSMWGVGNDYAGWEGKRERCREIWSRVADSADNAITR